MNGAGARAVLETAGLAAGYGRKRVVHGIDLRLLEGEILLVLGHNGAGKTTLMRAIFGLNRPMAGSVSFAGRDITGRTPAANVADGIAFVPQGHGIFRTLSVRDNLALGAFVERDQGKLPERLESVFGLFPILRERAGQIGGTLSGGQQQMLAIGMALMHGPRVLILDEPSIGLAPNLVERVMQSIVTINRGFGTTILMVEQNVALSLPIAGRAIVIKTGEVVYEGDPAPLHDHVRLMQLF
jgi:branched-chain amino acid transport system ATP-binding protein